MGEERDNAAAAMAGVVCVRCAYELRGLTADVNCPECGLAVHRTLALGKQLADSRPGWIGSLAWAARLLLLALVLPVVWMAPPALWWEVGRRAGRWGDFWRRVMDYPWQDVCLVAVVVVHFAGCWLLTRRENPHAARNPLKWHAIGLRVLAVGPVVAAVVVAVVNIFGYRWLQTYRFSGPVWWRYYEWMRWVRSGAFTLMLAYAPCPAIQFVLLRRLAVRVLNQRLAEHSTIVAIGFPVSVGALLLIMTGVIRLNLNDSPGFWATLAVWVSVGLFWLWSMYVFRLFARAFGKAAREARAADAADAAGGR